MFVCVSVYIYIYISYVCMYVRICISSVYIYACMCVDIIAHVAHVGSFVCSGDSYSCTCRYS